MRVSCLYISVKPAASIAARSVLKFPSDFSSSMIEAILRELRPEVRVGEESLNASKELIEKATQSMKKMLMFMTNCRH